MNLFKKFIRNENETDLESEDYENLYVGEETNVFDEAEEETISESSRNPYGNGNEKVSLKLLQPKSNKEAPMIADWLKGGSIVLLDIGELPKDQARRLIDFLAGVVYMLGGEMTKSNKNTIIVSPSDVDISDFAIERMDSSAPAEEETAQEDPNA